MKKPEVFFVDYALTYLGVLSTLMLFTACFSLPGSHLPALLLPISLISVGIFSLPKFRKLALCLCLVLIGFWIYRSAGQILRGFEVAIHIVAQRASNQFGVNLYIGSQTSAAGNTRALKAMIDLFALGLSLFLGWTIARSHSGFLSCLATIPLFIISISLTSRPNKLLVFLIILYWILVLMPSVVKSMDSRLGIRVMLAVLPLAVLLMLAIAAIFPESNYTRAQWPDDLYLSIQTRIEDAFNIEPPTPSAAPEISGAADNLLSEDMDKVDLSNAGPRRYTGNTILRITTDTPGPMYLRGYSMSHYLNNTWINNSPLNYDDIAPLPAYSSQYKENALHTEPLNFASYSMLGNDSAREGTVEIYNVASRSGIAYVPYFLTGYGFISDDSKILSSPFGEHSIVTGTSITASFVKADYDTSALPPSYTVSEDEALYREYVYHTYLDVPNDLGDSLRLIALDAGIHSYMERGEIAAAVADYIKNAASYNLNTPRTPANEDFILYFLTQSQEGYCMHFASAATVMLQALGVPARYVSGYAVTVTPENAGKPINVLDRNAHAWVEVYYDGVGWLPYEVTGGSGNPEALGSETESSPAAATPSPSPSAAPETTVTPEDGNESTDDISKNRDKLFFILLLPLILVIIVLRRTYVLFTRTRIAQSDDNNYIAIHTWIYIEKLHRYGGNPPEELHELALKARFSQHSLTQTELDSLIEYSQNLAMEVESKLQIHQKLIFRYIRAL